MPQTAGRDSVVRATVGGALVAGRVPLDVGRGTRYQVQRGAAVGDLSHGSVGRTGPGQ